MKNDRYEESDFVKVVDGAGNVQPDAVPKKWVGTDLLPDGFKVAPKAAVKDAEKDSEES